MNKIRLIDERQEPHTREIVDGYPCPYCGGDQLSINTITVSRGTKTALATIIGCDSCNVEFGTTNDFGWDDEHVKNHLLEKWNTRTQKKRTGKWILNKFFED